MYGIQHNELYHNVFLLNILADWFNIPYNFLYRLSWSPLFRSVNNAIQNYTFLKQLIEIEYDSMSL